MLYLVKLFPEITIKTRPVRRRFIRQLRKNIKAVLLEFDETVTVSGEWDSIEVVSSSEDPVVLAQMSERLSCTPGIAKFLEVDKFPLPDMEGMLQLAYKFYADKLEGKTFAVRCKRNGRHAFKSMDVERFVGAG